MDVLKYFVICFLIQTFCRVFPPTSPITHRRCIAFSSCARKTIQNLKNHQGNCLICVTPCLGHAFSNICFGSTFTIFLITCRKCLIYFVKGTAEQTLEVCTCICYWWRINIEKTYCIGYKEVQRLWP